ncbi:DUF4389 domain-containing protein [bacterium]|nr:DUF4389 domain-containing protein [bacterium]
MFVLANEFRNMIAELFIHDRVGVCLHMYPALFSVDRPATSSRLLLIFRPILLLPHLFWAYFYGMAAGLLQFISFWAIIFTGRHPQALWEFLTGYLRYRSRLNAYWLLLSDIYPPFKGEAGQYPVRVHVDYPDRLSRLTVFFRLLILFPHLFFSIGYIFVSSIVSFLAFWTVLFAGKLARWQFEWLYGWFIYTSRLDAYMLYLVDEYPPFNGSQPRAAGERFPNETRIRE